jgi:predicted nicotinamide N-methyase
VAAAEPLRTSLEEQLVRMRGGGSLPDPLLDVVSEEVEAGGETLTVIRPGDWAELRHQEGAEGRSAPYWAIVWPSGLVLGDALAERDLEGARVLELGCGLAIPSLVAALRGASVTATDGSPDAVVFAAHNLALNHLDGEVALADWRDAEILLEGAPWDLVLASDVLYLRHNVEALLRLLPKLIGRSGEALVSDPSRAGGREFVASAKRIFSLETRHDPARKQVAVHALRPRSL